MIDPEGWKVLKYEKGDFFTKHKDQIGMYTALFFHENSDCEGGELVIDNQEFITYGLNRIIIFSTDKFHEVREITKGHRYVFKTSLIRNQKNVKDIVYVTYIT